MHQVRIPVLSNMRHKLSIPAPAAALAAFLLLVACAPAPVVNDNMQKVQGPLPANFEGSWERDYSRGEDMNGALRAAWYELSRTIPDQYYGSRGPVQQGPSQQDVNSLMALARLAEAITRSDVLTIFQDDHEVRVEREDDFALLCGFFNGQAKPTESEFGREVCGWSGSNLVSNMTLPDGLQIVHRFTVSDDHQNLRVITTLSSKYAKVPFTINRFYRRFERPTSNFNCIETLTMKRVCSTGELEL